MRLSTILILTFIPFLSLSQKYKRNTFKYDKLPSENFAQCDETTNSLLDNSLLAIEQNNSAFAVANSKKVYETNKDCFFVFDTYGYALFRNGKWFEGLEIIEEGIKKFGSVPQLIERKYRMSMEMGDLGTGQKNIDGSSVYRANSIPYEEEQFRQENFKSALVDLKYLIKIYNRSEEIFYAAKVHQALKQFDESNTYFQKLLLDEEYKLDAGYYLAENYIAQNKLTEAETELIKLLVDFPKEGVIYDKLSEVYQLKKEGPKSREYQQKGLFYNNIPNFLDVEYSKENFNLLLTFGTDEKSAEMKIDQLNALYEKNNPAVTIDFCLIILKLHANHGNGLEERATEILKEIGKPGIEKVNLMFQQNISTCTIASLGEVMAKVKDESSWQLMTEYLPEIANMPITMMPPNLPEKLILFDEERGLREILKVVKPLLVTKKESQGKQNPMDELKGFGQYVFYAPLKKIDKAKLKTVAKELNYTDEEFGLLEQKLD